MTLLNSLARLNQNLTEKVSQYSDTTYSEVKGLGYDSTNKKLGLIVEEGGADTLVPFSGGNVDVLAVVTFPMDGVPGSISPYGYGCYIFTKDGMKSTGYGSTPYEDDNIKIEYYNNQNAYRARVTIKDMDNLFSFEGHGGLAGSYSLIVDEPGYVIVLAQAGGILDVPQATGSTWWGGTFVLYKGDPR